MSSQNCTCGGACAACAPFGMYPMPPTQPDMPTVAGANIPFDDSEYFDWDAVDSLLANQSVDGYKPTPAISNVGSYPPGGQCAESGYASQQPYQPQHPAVEENLLPLHHQQPTLAVPNRRSQPRDDKTIELPRHPQLDHYSNTFIPVGMGVGLAGNAVKRREAPKSNGKRQARAIESHDAAEERSPKAPKLYDASEHLPFTKEQTDLLDVKLKQCQEKSRLPADKELKTIAAACDLSSLQVALWFGAKLRLDQGPAGPRPQPSDAPQSPRANDLSALIWKYISDAKTKECTHGRSTGRYRCTWGCPYSTDSRFDWERHEESKQPQKFWACISCRGTANPNPFITHRQDKIFPHIHSIHPAEEGNKNQLRENSKVHYEAPFVRTCSYRLPSTGQECSATFNSWKERNDHWIAHFNGDDASDEVLHPHGGDTGSGSSPDSSNSHPADISMTDNSSSSSTQHSNGGGQTSSQRYSAGRQRAPKAVSDGSNIKTGPAGLSRHTQESGPLSFIDVHKRELVTMDMTSTMFLALDCNVTDMPKLPQEACLKLSESTKLSLPARDGAVTVLKAAIELAVEMGFQYLWTDMISSAPLPPASRDATYNAAMLITSMGFRKNDKQQIWHFTSDYKNLDKVRSWSNNRDWFRHVTPLGQGAYGFVDKVELFSSPDETYARKIVLRDRTNKLQRARYLKEIQIMQSLDHQHIARFVAAYCDRTAFNILMSPVADCDLRQFLSDPAHFQDKLPHLPHWFTYLAKALEYMHNKNFRHKDIKPANILVSGDNVLLTDFGTSLHLSNSTSTTTGGAFLTPKYSAPEVAAQQERGLPADIFSLGCVFAEMIAIESGRSLEQFHTEIGLADEETEGGANYNQRIPALQTWLRSLAGTTSKASLSRAIFIASRMISSDLTQRPSAAGVVHALSSEPTSLGMFHGNLRHEMFTIGNYFSQGVSDFDLAQLNHEEPVLLDVSSGDAFSHQATFTLQDLLCEAMRAPTPTGQRKLCNIRRSTEAERKRMSDEYAMVLRSTEMDAEDIQAANTIRGMRRV